MSETKDYLPSQLPLLLRLLELPHYTSSQTLFEKRHYRG